MEISENLSEKGKRDVLLVQNALSGDQTAYTQLMKLYKNSVYHTIFKMVRNNDDADDLTMEAFGKAFNRLEQYSPDFAFSTWLFKIATNNCIDFMRKKRVPVASIDVGIENKDGAFFFIEPKTNEKTPEEELIHQQKIKTMRAFVDKIKPKYKELLELRYFEELSYEEISDALNLPLGTIKVQLFRARESLATLMEKNNTKGRI